MPALATQEQIYRMGGAAGAGFACTLIRKKGVGDWMDLIFAAGIGALGFLAGASLRGTTAELSAGAMDGAAAYIGSRIPEIVGTKSTSFGVSYAPVPYTPSVSYPPEGYGSSAMEI